ncbi:hypothetical protein R9C00_23530 [Flammeovirgaceae bacterium SG7u.111]|nr:hypothetical protein [Flammeovirgaceae bacterium SG7u.132]WPO34677.1 hypothetical protein R9C00_23530 [Flammeovirgaceae bacterium SG7u.111]
MNLGKNKVLVFIVAAILLAGLGIYYFLFERQHTEWWLVLLGGGLLNLYLAYQAKSGKL